MEYLNRYLKLWAGLNYTNAFLKQQLQAGRLDDVLADILRARQEVTFYQKLYPGTGDERTRLIQQAQVQLEKLEQKVIGVYVSWFEKHEVVGSREAYRSPDVIVVLGASEPTLTLRVKAAFATIKKHPQAVVVLSGGGFSPDRTEAMRMNDTLQSYLSSGMQDIPNRVLLETDSMDTLGNALFTKLTLARAGVLANAKNILVITSRFHAMRAEHFFEIIFNQCAVQKKSPAQSTATLSAVANANGKSKPFKLAVQGVRTAKNGQEELLSVHELSTEYNAETTLNIFPTSPMSTRGKANEGPDFSRIGGVDEEWVLLQLFRNHALYRNRYDLLRKYLNHHTE